MKLAIFGARKKSIGQTVGKYWSDMYDGKVVTAGISGEEDYTVNMSDDEEITNFLAAEQPDRVLVTIGMNEEMSDKEGMDFWLADHFAVNVIMPMQILELWKGVGLPDGGHFVAISSNSAHIPRSQSMAYCSTKAALSMALRCAARDAMKAGVDFSIYGWEPGLVKGTPMSGSRGGTRMLGHPEGLTRRALALQIVNTMAFGGTEYSGVLVRLDNGEV